MSSTKVVPTYKITIHVCQHLFIHTHYTVYYHGSQFCSNFNSSYDEWSWASFLEIIKIIATITNNISLALCTKHYSKYFTFINHSILTLEMRKLRQKDIKNLHKLVSDSVKTWSPAALSHHVHSSPVGLTCLRAHMPSFYMKSLFFLLDCFSSFIGVHCMIRRLS